MDKKRIVIIVAAAAVVLGIGLFIILKYVGGGPDYDELADTVEQEPVNLLYGIESDDYDIEQGTIQSGQTMGALFGKYGVGSARVDAISRLADSVFNFRNIRAGNDYSVFLSKDSLARLDYFVYEVNQTEFLVIDLRQESDPQLYLDRKEVTLRRVMKSAEITSSFWNAMVGNGMSPALAQELSDVYAWTIDFFGIQKGDKFGVVYDERYVDTVKIGVGMIWGSWFDHGGKRYYAIPFDQDGKLSYWDENGNSLRKNFLKAPLSFSRVSSKFSNARMHPVLRIVRPHHGVDYAAPAGTPVYAIGDGTVVFKGWDGGGGGNMLKIKHAGNLVSGYLHLRGYAKGINQGTRVSQGDHIGYVGSTGVSTGPHLDFRVWRGGTAIDPLKIPTEPAEPISEANKQAFNIIRDRIMAELNDQNLPDSLKVTSLEVVGATVSSPQADTLTSPKADE